MKIERNVPLKNKNWFQTGGAAQYFASPRTSEEFADALDYAGDHHLDVTLLGLGANVLISDEGIDGLVIRPNMREITVHTHSTTLTSGSLCSGRTEGQKNHVTKKPVRTERSVAKSNVSERELIAHITAQAGVPIQMLINKSLEHNLIGLEEFSGIPGTVGGATYMNIHYFNSSWADFVVHAQVIDKKTGEIITVQKDWFNYGYDTSALHNKEHYLISTTLALKSGTEIDAAYARGRRDEIIRQRNSRYPTNRTCGSFFRNFHEHELTQVKNAKPLPFVAYYLDKLGIKGELHVGDAIVSHKHANMIENRENATSNEIIELARTMQKMAYERFGVLPQVECQLLGFTNNPI